MSCQTPSCKRLRSGSGLARRSGSTSDRKSTRLNSSYDQISYAVFCLKKKNRRVLFRSDRKSTRLNSSHDQISYAVFCLKKKQTTTDTTSVATSYSSTASKLTRQITM